MRLAKIFALVFVAMLFVVPISAGRRRAVGVGSPDQPAPVATPWQGIGMTFIGTSADGDPIVELVPVVPADGIIRAAVLNCDRDEVGDDFIVKDIPVAKRNDGTYVIGVSWVEIEDYYALSGSPRKKPVFWARSDADGAYYSYVAEMVARPDTASPPCVTK